MSKRAHSKAKQEHDESDIAVEDEGFEATVEMPSTFTGEQSADAGGTDESALDDEEDDDAEAGAGSDPKRELSQVREQLLRMAADFDNYRKRSRKEIDDARKFGIERLLNDLLPVLDNLERALMHSGEEKNPVIQGVKMVFKQFEDAVSHYGVKGFQSIGESFNPERHDAIGQEETDEHAPGTVLKEVSKGYMLHDRLMRAARVVVAKAVSETTEDGSEEGENEEDNE